MRIKFNENRIPSAEKNEMHAHKKNYVDLNILEFHSNSYSVGQFSCYLFYTGYNHAMQ